MVSAYASLWPCLSLLYYAYLAAVEQTPDPEQESATHATVRPKGTAAHTHIEDIVAVGGV